MNQYPVYTDLEYTDEMNAYNIDQSLRDDRFTLEAYQRELFMYQSNDVIQEAYHKKNVFQKIWEFIKSVFRKLCKVLKWVGEKIRSLFKNKKRASIDQIIQKCKLTPKRRRTQEAVATFNADKLHETVIHFPASKGSDFTETDLRVAAKRLYIKIVNNEFVTSVPGIQQNIPYEGPNRINNWQLHYYATCAVMDETKWYELLFDSADMLAYIENMGGLVDIEPGFVENINKLWNGIYTEDMKNKYKDGLTIHIKDFTKFQQQIFSASEKIDKVQVVEGISDELLEALNRFADILSSLSFGMNEFNRSIQQMYMLDEIYIGSVNTSDLLDIFVYECIMQGVPPKFISYNTWLLLDDAWKTNKDTFYTKDIHPKWGQTRTVFDIKDLEYVVKIAMSGVGIRCNRNEIDVTTQFKKYHLEHLIAYVEEYGKHAAVIFPHAIVSYMIPTKGDVYEYQGNLVDVYWDYPDLPDIRGDIHVKNVGFDELHNIVCIDYAGVPIRKG